VRDARHCPACGSLLHFEDPSDPSFSALRFVAVDLLRWAALALLLAFLWAPSEVREWYAALAFVAFAAWLYLRPRQRAQAARLLAHRRYRCPRCQREYAGGDLA